MRSILGKWYNTWYYNQVMAKIEPDTSIDMDLFFKQSNPSEVPVQNGILNIETRELTPFTSKKIFFSKLPVIYNSNAKCPKISQFLSEVLAHPDDRIVFYEIGGFALLKEYRFEKAVMFHGSGRNGKGKAIDLFRRVIGMENCASVPLAALVPDSFQVSELYGKFLNLAGDLNNTDLKETGMFKSLTGRDLVGGKRKFLRDLYFENYAKFIFACNELPMVYDISKGFWDRWILLNFPYYFADRDKYENASEAERKDWKIRDPDILNKITTPEELSGLLNEFLDGLDRLKKNEKFSFTVGCDEIKADWIRKANSFVAFCYDNIEEEYDKRIVKKELRKKYSDYCKEHKVSPKSDKVIKSVLQDTYGASEGYALTNNSYNQEHIWEGIKWKN